MASHKKMLHNLFHMISASKQAFIDVLSLYANSFLLQTWQIKLLKGYKAWKTFLQKCQKGFANACIVMNLQVFRHSESSLYSFCLIKIKKQIAMRHCWRPQTSGWISGWLIIPPREHLHLCDYGVDKMSLWEIMDDSGLPGRFPGYPQPPNPIGFRQQQTVYALMVCTTFCTFTQEFFLYSAWSEQKLMTGQVNYFQINLSIRT